jgi:hypothetical protein
MGRSNREARRTMAQTYAKHPTLPWPPDIPGPQGYAGIESSGSEGGTIMADKSPKKSSTKTAASKSLKEKRADKKDKASKRKSD